MGLWVVLEGADGVGKTTTTSAVYDKLVNELPGTEIIKSAHPGATVLGQLVRNVSKHPESVNVNVDPLSTQLLMAIDHISFKNEILLPAMERNAIVLADRCDLIGTIVYGSAMGLSDQQINSIIGLICKPRIDMLFVLSCDEKTQRQRLATHQQLDRFDKMPQDNLNNLYRNLAIAKTSPEQTVLVNRIVALENIKYVYTNQPIGVIVDSIVSDIVNKFKSLSN